MKNRKGEVTIGTIILMLIGVIVGLILIQEIFNQQSQMTSKNPVTNESITVTRIAGGAVNVTKQNVLTYAPTSDKWQYGGKCPANGLVLIQNNGTTLIADTDYFYTGAYGNLTFANTANVQQGNTTNSTKVSYLYCPDGYNTDTSSRSIAGLIGLFSVFILLAYLLETGRLQEWFGRVD